MSRLVLGFSVLALSLAVFNGCATLSQVRADFQARVAVSQGVEPPWECGEPAADASAHDDIGQSSSEGESSQ